MAPMATQKGIETEIKLAVENLAAARRKLRALGYLVSQPRSLETNTLYDRSSDSLRSSGQLVRLRQWRRRWILTFKGPGSVTRQGHKARPESECELSTPEPVIKTLAAAGLKPTLQYEKFRTEFAKPSSPGTVLLDETPAGNFLELEGPSAWIDRTAKALGYAPADYIASSYLTIYFDQCRKKGIQAADMLFQRSRRKRDTRIPPGANLKSNSRTAS